VAAESLVSGRSYQSVGGVTGQWAELLVSGVTEQWTKLLGSGGLLVSGRGH